MSYIELAIGLALNIASSYFLFSLYKTLFTCRGNRFVRILAFFCLTYLLGTIIYPEELTNTLFSLIGFLGITFIFFHGKFIEQLSFVFIFYPIFISINFMSENIGLMIYKTQVSMSHTRQTWLYFATIVLRIPIWFIIWRIGKSRLKEARILNQKMWITLDIICLTPLISLIALLYYTPMAYGFTVYPVCIGIIITNMGCVYLASYIAKTLHTETEVQSLRYQQTYYAELDYSQHQIRKLSHDMQNHLNVIASLLAEDKKEEAENYIEQFSDRLPSGNREFSRNSIVNSVLNYKYNMAILKNIDCFFNVSIDELQNLDDISVCSLLSNTLDNAIEACDKISDLSKRYISLKSRTVNNHFIYELTNSKINPIIKKGDGFVTGKSDSLIHGYGLLNVREIVEKYQGTLDYSYTDTEFTVTVLIPLQ